MRVYNSRTSGSTNAIKFTTALANWAHFCEVWKRKAQWVLLFYNIFCIFVFKWIFGTFLTEKKNDDLTRLIESKTADFINEKNGLEQEIRQLSDNFEGVSNENNRLKERLAGLEMDNQKLRILNPQEDIWCSCNRQAFGEMIACDNRNCTIKWFHLECVSLTEAPKGKWFCPDCR